jgi:cobalt-zinc-cadmium efflux system protein
LKVKESILNVEHIQDVDDLHIWTMGAGEPALSCHIVIEDCSVSESVKIVSALKQMLKNEYSITHATIETQTECGPHDDERVDEGLSSER